MGGQGTGSRGMNERFERDWEVGCEGPHEHKWWPGRGSGLGGREDRAESPILSDSTNQPLKNARKERRFDSFS